MSLKHRLHFAFRLAGLPGLALLATGLHCGPQGLRPALMGTTCNVATDCPAAACGSSPTCGGGNHCYYQPSTSPNCPCIEGEVRTCTSGAGSETCNALTATQTEWGGCSNVCANNAVRCENGLPQSCVNGQWQDGAACSAGTTCVNGSCAQCLEGAMQCAGTQVQTCAGGAWSAPALCGSAQACVRQACKPATFLGELDRNGGPTVPVPMHVLWCSMGLASPAAELNAAVLTSGSSRLTFENAGPMGWELKSFPNKSQISVWLDGEMLVYYEVELAHSGGHAEVGMLSATYDIQGKGTAWLVRDADGRRLDFVDDVKRERLVRALRGCAGGPTSNDRRGYVAGPMQADGTLKIDTYNLIEPDPRR